MTKIEFYLAKTTSLLWVRPTILSLAALVWVAGSYFADRYLPEAGWVKIEKSTLVNLFTILASTMLTVATFSVSAVAVAFGSVATSATPRATEIVMSDSSVKSTLAAFLAAFIYAVVSITALSAVDFGASGRFMLFLGFVVLVGWVLMSFLRWVDRVSRLGKLGDTLARVTEAGRAAFAGADMAGLLGGRDLSEESCPDDAWILRSEGSGYLQYLDMEELQRLAEKLDGQIWLEVRPGSHLSVNAPIARLSGSRTPEEGEAKELWQCLNLGVKRDHRTDPRAVMIVFAEIAARALSPAVNDPGTAIEVLSIQLELFHSWAENDCERAAEKKVKFDRVFLPAITAEDLIYDAFTPIARDGAGMIEVCLRLQKTLRALMIMDHAGLRDAADAYRSLALELSDAALPVASQRKVVAELARRDVDRKT